MNSLAGLRLRPDDLATGRPYAERDEREPSGLDDAAMAAWHGLLLPLARPLRLRERQARRIVRRTAAAGAALDALDDAQLRTRALRLGREIRRRGFRAEPVAQCFAVVREAGRRALGRPHYDSQVAAGWGLVRGALVEMATGEGKTYAATLAAVTAALAGLPVHVITVNDYLAERDRAGLAPLYGFFGLSTAFIAHAATREERRALYGRQVVYCSNKELSFDYLRDRAALRERSSPLHAAVDRAAGAPATPPVLRGLVFAIVDEADSIFIDEARTPLVLSAQRDDRAEAERCAVALAQAYRLSIGRDFRVDAAERRIRLGPGAGAALSLDEDEPAGSPFASARQREEAVEQALAALHLYLRDRHYVVVDGKVQIVDESTGRAMPDRAWENGLQQMVEAKEGLEPTGARETLARITYQRLFRRYLHLCGMTGTGTEVASEIGRVYGLPVVRVPLHRPSRRRMLAARCLPDAAAKWAAVADAVAQAALQEGRPVLVGTRTVEASEALSAVLAARGIEHVVLNAKQDGDEAAIIARAGEPGRVTVATNMAGRGTDVALAEGVEAAGGLHVVLTEFHESRRVDRQLYGRAARQGDRGSAQAIVALDDELFQTYVPGACGWLGPGARAQPWATWVLPMLRWLAQSAAERRHRATRTASLRHDRRMSRMLAFAGRCE